MTKKRFIYLLRKMPILLISELFRQTRRNFLPLPNKTHRPVYTNRYFSVLNRAIKPPSTCNEIKMCNHFLVHPNNRALEVAQKLFTGLRKSNDDFEKCHPCSFGKAHWKACNFYFQKTAFVGEAIHSNGVGLQSVAVEKPLFLFFS